MSKEEDEERKNRVQQLRSRQKMMKKKENGEGVGSWSEGKERASTLGARNNESDTLASILPLKSQAEVVKVGGRGATEFERKSCINQTEVM